MPFKDPFERNGSATSEERRIPVERSDERALQGWTRAIRRRHLPRKCVPAVDGGFKAKNGCRTSRTQRPTQDWRTLHRTGGRYTGPYPGTQHLSGPQQELCLKTSEVKNLHACEQFFFSLPSAGLPAGEMDIYIQAAQEGPEMVTAHIPETIGRGDHPIAPVSQDESTFYANDGRTEGWVTEQWYLSRPKGEGSSINVPDFVTPAGRLRARQGTPAHLLPQYGLAEGRRMDPASALNMLECGQGTWWNSERLVKQLEPVAIPIFNLAFPECQALFVFDSASLHCSYKSDARRAANINLYTCGQEPLMRPGRDQKERREDSRRNRGTSSEVELLVLVSVLLLPPSDGLLLLIYKRS
jgi:hypothetical protein